MAINFGGRVSRNVFKYKEHNLYIGECGCIALAQCGLFGVGKGQGLKG